MSPTSLANRGLTAKRPPRRRLHRRFASLVSSLPLRARAVLVLALVLLTWRYSGPAQSHPSTSPTTLARQFAAVRFARAAAPPKARLRFANGAVQDVYASPGTGGGSEVVYEAVWESSGIVGAEVPVGGRLRWRDQGGEEGELLQWGKEDVCAKGECEGITEVRLERDVLLGLKQMRLSTSDDEMRYYSPPPHTLFAPAAVTLVTQFTVSRLSRFERMLEAWDGPLSATIYLTEALDIPTLEAHLSSASLSPRWKNVALTIVKPDYSTSEEALLARVQYPINKLRNFAIAAAPAPHVLVIDVDFVPSPGMHDLLSSQAVPLLSHPSSRNSLSPTLHRTALVISTFACVPTFNASFPSTLSNLRTLYTANPPLITLTDPNSGHGPSLPSLLFSPPPPATAHRPLGHLQPSATYEARYEPQWEPYYLLERASHPLYDERFTDQGGDKQAHAVLLNALGYEFRVVRDVWVLHPPKADKAEEEWPAARLLKRAAVERGRVAGVGAEGSDGKEDEEEGVHFNLEAQRDETRFRYFQDYLPEAERIWGGNFRWPGGSSARSVGERSFGRGRAATVFGL